MAIKTFAAIDVGSFELTLKIYEFSGKNRMKEVDCLATRLALGTDTYADGKISNENIEELCHVLGGFAQVMKTYKVDSYRAYGTSAIRETQNYTIVLDKIAQRTGIHVEILSNSEQRFLDYKSVASQGENFQKFLVEPTAIVDIGGGSLQISLFEQDALVSTQNLRLGVLRMQERLQHLRAGREQLTKLIDEMATAQLTPYRKLYLGDKKIKNLIIIDDYISPWAVRAAAQRKTEAIVSKQQFEELREQIMNHSEYETARAMDIAQEKVPLMEISMVLIQRIAQLMGAECIWAPGVSLCDGMAYEYGENNKLLSLQHDFERDIVACASNISKRYQGSRKRAETLGKIAGTIFDSTKKIHGLGKRERLYLEIATILHDCGKYISLNNIGERSYDIVMATEIIGLSHKEREIVANVVRFNHSEFIYFGQQKNGSSALDEASYLTVAKLTAILRVANSLDRSHKQKMKEVKARLVDNELQLSLDSNENILLEQAFFADSAAFFEEVFSIHPILKQKKTI